MRSLRRAQHAAIVNTVSISALTGGSPGSAIYSATKAFVSTYSKALARELAPDGIRVNCVHPDGGNPEMSQEFLPAGMDPAEAMAGHVHRILAPARGRPRNDRMRDVANMILFLASDEGAGCTGGDYPVDGGYSAGTRFT